jgi:hypothetical protein
MEMKWAGKAALIFQVANPIELFDYDHSNP